MVTCLHAADVHLGLRTTRFDPKSAQKVREARFQALDNVLRTAREERADLLLVAGDLFDDHAVDGLTARRAFEMLEAAPMPVYVLPGNHDPLLAGTVWDRPPWNADPPRLTVLRRPEPVTALPGVVVLPCPVFAKTSLNDPTAWIAREPPNGAVIRIGLAHGSLKVRDDLPADDHLIPPRAARDLGLDYLALGHWHGRRLFPEPDGPMRTAYPGVPEPMRYPGASETRTGWLPYSGGARPEFLDAGKGEVLVVKVERPGEAPNVRPVEVGHLIWEEERRDLRSEDDLARLIAEVATRPMLERRLLRLCLTGVLAASAMARLEELRQILGGRYFLGEMDDAGLHVQPSPEEVEQVAGQGVVRRVLGALQAEAAGSDPALKRRAERALVLLYQIAREVGA
jgi:DNA repair exonuclease SbcCD nuclease subunit